MAHECPEPGEVVRVSALENLRGRLVANRRSWPTPPCTAGLVLLMSSVLSIGQARGHDGLTPSAAFIDTGTTGRTHEVSAGLMWDWNRRSKTMTIGWGGYWE